MTSVRMATPAPKASFPFDVLQPLTGSVAIKKAARTRAPEKMCCAGEGLVSGPNSHSGIEITIVVAITATMPGNDTFPQQVDAAQGVKVGDPLPAPAAKVTEDRCAADFGDQQVLPHAGPELIQRCCAGDAVPVQRSGKPPGKDGLCRFKQAGQAG